jgi:hypothetical protein
MHVTIGTWRGGLGIDDEWFAGFPVPDVVFVADRLQFETDTGSNPAAVALLPPAVSAAFGAA